MKHPAFTLAEILIVLTIIGFLSSITVPSLIKNTQSQSKITKFKKAFSVISNAYATEYATKRTPTNVDSLFNGLAKRLNVKYYINNSNNNERSFNKPNSNYSDYYIVTDDGIGYKIQESSGSCLISKLALIIFSPSLKSLAFVFTLILLLL